MLKAVPYQIHTILADKGIHFADHPCNRNTIYSQPMRLNGICKANGIENRFIKPNLSQTNGQVERMSTAILGSDHQACTLR